MSFEVPVTMFHPPHGKRVDDTIVVDNDGLRPVVDRILNAGYHFEGEFLLDYSVLNITIAGKAEHGEDDDLASILIFKETEDVRAALQAKFADMVNEFVEGME